MPPTALTAIEFLDQPSTTVPGVIAAYGDDAFLRQQVIARCKSLVLGDDDGQFSQNTFDGRSAALRDVLDELSTGALFGSGRRLIVVADADEFVTRFRERLEEYAARPKASAVLLLDVVRWPANTRLAKAVAASGLAIDCSAPAPARLPSVVIAWAKSHYKTSIARDAAEMLVEIVGNELGLIDQELAKLSGFTPPGKAIEASAVQALAGSWRTQTVWEMLDLAVAGQAGQAIALLDRLLAAGESPIAVLGQIGSSLRRFATATRLIEAAEAKGQRLPLRGALETAGVRGFVLAKAEAQLRQLGRQRAAQLHAWLLQADLDLKGASNLPARVILERLLVRMSAAMQPKPAAPATRR
ncbi:MAG: DNA polymerase III subunit delta [Pirellulales bacterium]|nr:DNA polymerase III subunit delta [Pirellulales bacterium]